VKEICTIDSSIWSVHEAPDPKAFNYAFYDLDSGEVWGKRVLVGRPTAEWLYIGRPKSSQDMLMPREWREPGQIPLGLLCAYFMGLSAHIDLIDSLSISEAVV